MKDNLSLDNRNDILELIDSYQDLLTEKQRNIIAAYFQYDLSLSEIAENEGISRAAVADALNKSIEKMKELEALLGLIKLKKHINKCESEIHKIDSISQKLAAYEKLVEDIKNGI